jgi:hypothetical protein
MSKLTKHQDRSPRYPGLSLREAIEKARALYQNEKRAMVPREVAVKSWGYGSLNGASLTILAAVTQYGLLLRKRGSVGISQEAFIILEAPRNSEDRIEALRTCARTPGIFQELLDKHENALPSDDALMWDLKQKGFTDQGAKAAIVRLRETISFVDEQTKGYTGGNEGEDQEGSGTEERLPMPESTTISQKPIGTVVSHSTVNKPGAWVFPLGEGTVSLWWSGIAPTVDILEALQEYLEVSKKHFRRTNKETINEQGPPISQ